MLRILFMFSLFWMSNVLSAQVYQNHLSGQDMNPLLTADISPPQYPSLTVDDDETGDYTNHHTIGRITLSYDDSEQVYYENYWKLIMSYSVIARDEKGAIFEATGAGSEEGEARKLSIFYDPEAGGIAYNDASVYVIENANEMEIEVWDIELENAEGNTVALSTVFPDGLPDDIRLVASIEVERYYEAYNLFLHNQEVGHTDLTEGEVRIYWDFVPGAVEYDLEFLHKYADMDNTNSNETDLAQSVTPSDWRRATRITTSQQYYDLKLIFEPGIVHYRVRPVGRKAPAYTHRLEGAWSLESSESDICSHCIEINDPFEEKRLWTYSSVYAEDGKQKEVMTYVDGTGRARQSQTINNSDEVAVVGETLYDYEGRAAVNVLPIPIHNKEDLAFYQSFSLTPSGVLDKDAFGAEANFDAEGNYLNAPKMKTSIGTDDQGHYYSSNNPQKDVGFNRYLPDAEGYPYTHTVFDRFGRAKMQSGVGFAHSMGQEHETRYLYAMPSQSRLDRLFGNEVGSREHYRRNIVIDANGQKSVSYEKLNGQVIATALIGKAPVDNDVLSVQTKLLDELDGSEGTNFDEPIMGGNDITEGQSFVQYQHMVSIDDTENDSDHSLVYSFDPASFTWSCPTDENIVMEGGDYDYNLLIEVLDDQDVVLSDITVSETGLTKEEYDSYTSDIDPFELEEGVYTIQKTLTINPNTVPTLETFATAYAQCYPVGDIPVEGDVEDDCILDGVPTFETCDALLKQFIADVIPNGGGQYANVTWYDHFLKATFDDVSPDYGIIADWLENPDVDDVVIDAFAAINEEEAVQILTNADIATHKPPTGSITDWSSLSEVWSNATQTQRTLWSVILAVHVHPEACHYIKCQTCKQDSGSNAFNDLITQLNEYSCCEIEGGDCCYVELAQTQSAEGTPSVDGNEMIDNVLANDPLFKGGSCLHDFMWEMEFTLKGLGSYPGWGPDGKNLWDYSEDLEDLCNTDDCPTPWQIFVRTYLYVKEELYRKHVIKECDDEFDGTPQEGTSANIFLTEEGYLHDNDWLDSGNPTNGVWNQGEETTSELPDQITYYLDNEYGNLLNNNIPIPFRIRVPDLIGFIEKFTNFSSIEELTDEINNQQDELNEELGEIADGIEEVNDEFCATCPDCSDPDVTCSLACKMCNLKNTPPKNCFCIELDYMITTIGLGNYNETGYDLVSDFYYNTYGLDLNYEHIEVWINQCQASDNTIPMEQLSILTSSFPELNCENQEEECDIYEQWANDLQTHIQQQLYQQQLQAAYQQMLTAYYEQAFEGIDEQFTLSYKDLEYHHTLYYYDNAGNLTRTVPPEGVDQLTTTTELQAVTNHRAGTVANPTIPAHSLVTYYEYNSKNQVVHQRTPDAGKTNFIYDTEGLMRFSQNQRQAEENAGVYSYTLYDEQQRIVEVGEVSGMPTDITNPLMAVPANNKTEITQTAYDDFEEGETDDNTSWQDNLRTRVAQTSIDHDGDGDPEQISRYSYDIHGNVKKLWCTSEMPVKGETKRLTTWLEYDYDLISGNVLEVRYQPGIGSFSGYDRFFHRYEYDADNRLTHAFTSRDGFIWDQDAKYFYYTHGPLARVELGDKKVQGIDYAYTLQGWLKGVNSNQLDVKYDIGKDGQKLAMSDIGNTYLPATVGIHSLVARDAYGFTLGYFGVDADFNGAYDDYKPISTSTSFQFEAKRQTYKNNAVSIHDVAKNLYNGNISTMVSSLWNTEDDAAQVTAYGFRYDQLNRLKRMKTRTDALSTSLTQLSPLNSDNYSVELSYDGNGNITELKRNAMGAMDDLTYNYATTGIGSNAKLLHNQLQHVDDVISPTTETVDIDDQDIGNYTYDGIGNLLSDEAEEIANIDWTVYGKIRSIQRESGSDKPNLYFYYDAMGNRIGKKVVKNTAPEIVLSYTQYARDASGNIMATYHHEYEPTDVVYTNGPISTPYTEHSGMIQLDHHLYGSSRLGTRSITYPDLSVNLDPTPPIDVAVSYNIGLNDQLLTHYNLNHHIGLKRYELSEHRGNVMSVISDKLLVAEVNTSGEILGYEADILQFGEYYPFGMKMPGELAKDGDYRFGYNGKEQDDELKGSGNSYDFGARMYDSRLGKFLSVDPKISEYPWETPYSFAGNRPINHIDKDGEHPLVVIWLVIEGGLALYDAYDVYSTLTDEQATALDKALSVGGAVLSAAAPGGGYSAADDIAELGAKNLNGISGWLSSKADAVISFGQKKYDEVSNYLGKKYDDFKNWLSDSGKGRKPKSKIDCACFTESTLVLTDKGYIEISEISAGEKVWVYTDSLGLQELIDISVEKTSSSPQIPVKGEDITITSATSEFSLLSDSPNMTEFTITNPKKLETVWLKKPKPLSQYTKKEKEIQLLLNDKEDRIITYSPANNEQLMRSIDREDITPYTWKWVQFEVEEREGQFANVHLRRPNWWIQESGATEIGKTIFLSVPEAGINGFAKVVNIKSNQLDTRLWDENREGDYVARPITGKVEHYANNVVDLYVDNDETNPISVTTNHLIWSNNRNNWVRVDSLQIGEQIKTHNNTVIVTGKKSKGGWFTVYDLELYQNHNFLVSTKNILAHNGCFDDFVKKFKREGNSLTKVKTIDEVNEIVGEFFGYLFRGNKIVDKHVIKTTLNHSGKSGKLEDWQKRVFKKMGFTVKKTENSWWIAMGNYRFRILKKKKVGPKETHSGNIEVKPGNLEWSDVDDRGPSSKRYKDNPKTGKSDDTVGNNKILLNE